MKIIHYPDTDGLIMDFGADYRKAVGRVDTHAIGDELVVSADEAGNFTRSRLWLMRPRG